MFTHQPLLVFRALPLLLLLLWNLSSFDLPFKGTGLLIDLEVGELLQTNVINWKPMTDTRHKEMRETAGCLGAKKVLEPDNDYRLS